MKLEREIKKLRKKMLAERQHLTDRINKINGVIDALNGTSAGRKRGPKKGRKLSAAHRRAIREGIAKSKARKAGAK